MKGVWVNSEPKSINALFAMPIEGTVTGCRVKVGANKLFCTAVVDKNNTLPQQQTPTSGIPQISTDSQYMPDLFRMPIENIGAGAQLEVVLDAIVPLNFVNYKYELNLPLTFSPGVLPTTKTVNDVVRISCLVNTVIPNLQVASNTHELAITRHDNICRMDVIARQPTVVNQTGMACQQSTDFHFAYSILSPGIIASNFIQPDVRDAQGKEHGTFALFVTPPQLKQQQEVFGRNFVFLMDCSGSMRGEPWQQAIAGLRSALAQLTTLDRFTVWAFDHRVMKLYETVVVPTMQTINQAIAWCEAIRTFLLFCVIHAHRSLSSSYMCISIKVKVCYHLDGWKDA